MKQALIIYGGLEDHEPERVAGIFAEILKNEGFGVTLSGTLDSFGDSKMLMNQNLIIPHWTDGEINPQYAANVLGAVASGAGLAGCHGGLCAAFSGCLEWHFMTGAQFVAHPGDDGVEYEVNITPNTGSEITKGINDFTIKSEQYYLHVDPVVNILATTRFPTTDGSHTPNGNVDVPVVYTKKWGKGKVFYNSLGHKASVFDIPEVIELTRRGFLWAKK